MLGVIGIVLLIGVIFGVSSMFGGGSDISQTNTIQPPTEVPAAITVYDMSTPTPVATDTRIPTSTLAATSTSTAVVATNTMPPSNSPGTCIAPPGEITLLAPTDGHGVSGEDLVTFEWEWSGSDLPHGYTFEVAIYNGPGLYDANEIGNKHAISGVSLKYQEYGELKWTVRIVCLDPYKETGRQAEPRMIYYQAAGGGGNF
ncbi:MAG: hypothetical protein B6242_11790 [Anaerolineaceae bacterium 4572_78]|nr:MAG: hypothetical protein B6242_11790 [Anaerolineaceae bacterium 4572_78]